MFELVAGRVRRRASRAKALLAIGAALAFLQSAPSIAQPKVGDQPLEAFESAIVEPSHPAGPAMLNVAPRTGDFTANNVSLAELVAFAYGVRVDQIVDLPVWAAAPRYHVEGRAPKELAGRDVQLLVEEVRPLVAGLLVDFFSLEAHRSQSPIYYVLEQAAGGARLRESVDQRAAPGSLAPSDAGLAGQRVRTGNIGTALEPLVGRHVLNQTGLYALYDVDFRWDTLERDPQKLAAELERQLGLTLSAVRLELLIVDGATELEGDGN